MTGILGISYKQWEIALVQLQRSPIGLKTIVLSVSVPWSGIHERSGLSIFAALPWKNLDDILGQFSSLERVDVVIAPCFVERREEHAEERLVDIGYFVHKHLSRDHATLTRVYFAEDVL